MKWYVVTPVYTRYSSYSPPETGADVAEVEADTKREALVKGVRELRKAGSDWISDQQSNGRSPFTGLKAYEAE